MIFVNIIPPERREDFVERVRREVAYRSAEYVRLHQPDSLDEVLNRQNPEA